MLKQTDKQLNQTVENIDSNQNTRNSLPKCSRALIVTPSSEAAMHVSGGVAKTYKTLTEQLEKAGVVVDFCTPWENLDYWTFPTYPEFRNVSASKANIQKMRTLISKADVVICSDGGEVIWLLTECFMQGKRCLWGLHTDMFNRSEALRIPSVFINILYYVGSYLSDIKFTTSYIFKDKLQKAGIGMDFVMNQDFKCGDFKVDDDVDEISNLRKRYLCDGTRYMVLYAGRLSKEKRIELLFRALPDHVTLVIVGDGPERDNIKALQAENKNVKLLTTMVTQDVLRQFYKAADLHVSASNGETYGMTVRESLYCKTAVVVQNDGGFIEQVRPNIDGYLVDYANSDDAKSAIEDACEMLHTFNPSPQNNDVVDLAKFISNKEYETIEPFSRIKGKRFLYYFIAIVQFGIVVMYYIVSFFSKMFNLCSLS